MAFYNDITLGQYYPGDSVLHRLDPRSKIIVTISVMSGLLLSEKWFIIVALAVIFFSAAALARLPIDLLLRNLKPFILLFVLTVLINLFWTPGRMMGRVPLLGLRMTVEGLHIGIIYGMRLMLLIVVTALLTLTTSPIDLTDAMEKLASPLKRLRMPVHETALMLTLAMRFIPTLIDEAGRIRNAQLSRGADFSGSLVRRIRGLIPLILPLFVSAFRRADELALAMDARCYTGGEGRSTYSRLRFRPADYFLIAASAVFLALCVVV